MSSQSDYAPDDWVLLRELPFKVILAAIVSDVSGPTGAASLETVYASRRLVGDARAYPDNALIAGLLADMANEPTGEGDEFALDDSAAKHQAVADAISECGRANEVLGAHASPDEADQYRRWLYDAAKAATTATKSGGFLGFGAKRISEREAGFLGQLATALGLPVELNLAS